MEKNEKNEKVFFVAYFQWIILWKTGGWVKKGKTCAKVAHFQWGCSGEGEKGVPQRSFTPSRPEIYVGAERSATLPLVPSVYSHLETILLHVS